MQPSHRHSTDPVYCYTPGRVHRNHRREKSARKTDCTNIFVELKNRTGRRVETFEGDFLSWRRLSHKMEEEILPSLLTSFSSTRVYAPLLVQNIRWKTWYLVGNTFEMEKLTLWYTCFRNARIIYRITFCAFLSLFLAFNFHFNFKYFPMHYFKSNYLNKVDRLHNLQY